MKILMTAHTIDEEGVHYPGEVIELKDALAVEWIKNQWALPVKKEIETPEAKEEKRETQTIRHQPPRHK